MAQYTCFFFYAFGRLTQCKITPAADVMIARCSREHACSSTQSYENLVTNSLDPGMEKKNLVVVKYSRTRKLDRIACPSPRYISSP